MKDFKIFCVFIFMGVLLLSCSSEVTSTNETDTPTPATSASPAVSNVKISKNKITLTGTNLDTVSSIQIMDKQNSNALAMYSITPQTLIISEQTATQLVATAATTLGLTLGALYNLVLTNAQATETTVTITYSIEDSSVALTKLATTDSAGTAITSGQVLTFDGTKWAPATTTASSTTVAAGSIDATKLADSAVTTAKIASGAVTATAIADSTITASKLASGAAPIYFFSSLVHMNGMGGATLFTSLVSSNNNQTATAARTKGRAPRAGTLKNLRILFTEGTMNTSNTNILTLMVNDSATSLSVTITDADDTAGTVIADTTHTAAVSAGDTFYLREVLSQVDISSADIYLSVSVELH